MASNTRDIIRGMKNFSCTISRISNQILHMQVEKSWVAMHFWLQPHWLTRLGIRTILHISAISWMSSWRIYMLMYMYIDEYGSWLHAASMPHHCLQRKDMQLSRSSRSCLGLVILSFLLISKVNFIASGTTARLGCTYKNDKNTDSKHS